MPQRFLNRGVFLLFLNVKIKVLSCRTLKGDLGGISIMEWSEDEKVRNLREKYNKGKTNCCCCCCCLVGVSLSILKFFRSIMSLALLFVKKTYSRFAVRMQIPHLTPK